MSKSNLRISANTSEVKKSLLDLSKDIKNLGKTKISVFSEADKKFIKNELRQELTLMKGKLVENRAELSKLLKEQNKLERGSKAELDHRKKILSAMQQQTRLASQMDRLQKQQKDMGLFGGGGRSSIVGKLGAIAGGGALALGGLALLRGAQASNQFVQGAPSRIRLRGLGQRSSGFGSPEELAAAGLTEQDFMRRQISATSRLGRAGGSRESIMQQARFERAFGLEEGSMANVSGAIRSSFGGRGADLAQSKLQASILAAGIEDAIGPYLEAATDLLSDINKNGLANTDEMVGLLAELTKDGKRTPEHIAEAFQGMDAAVRGASGEANAFLQTAFARGGIGGGTIGATRLAMSSGGIMGLSPQELAAQGFNPELIKNMGASGFTSGVGNRSGAILNQFKKSAGIRGNISDITDVNTMVPLAQMANSVLGTEGMGGMQALQMMEQVQNRKMTQTQFEQKLQDMRERKDPTIDRLSKINTSLEGQTEILRNINANLMEALGSKAVKVSNLAVEGNNAVVQGTGNVAGAVDSTGILDSLSTGAAKLRQMTVGGGLGSKLYDALHGGNAQSSAGSKDLHDAMTKAVEAGVVKGMKSRDNTTIQNNNKFNVRIQNGDGSVSNKTHR